MDFELVESVYNFYNNLYRDSVSGLYVSKWDKILCLYYNSYMEDNVFHIGKHMSIASIEKSLQLCRYRHIPNEWSRLEGVCLDISDVEYSNILDIDILEESCVLERFRRELLIKES